LEVSVTGDGFDDPAYRQALSKLPITQGAIFVSANYEAVKGILLDKAQDLGYFDFAFSQSKVRVSRKQLSANIKLIADTGVRYTYGPILFEQNLFKKSFLDRWLPFNEGDPYVSGLIGELTENLQNSGYFKSVRVQPQQDPRYGKTIPVKVELTPKDNNQVAVGLGFQTDTGIRTKLTWGKPLINRLGHSADAALSLSQIEQNASFSYRIPRRKEPLYNYWGIESGVKNVDIEDTKSLLSTLNFQRVSRTRTLWTESLFIRLEHERFSEGRDEETTDLVLPGFSYSRTRSKGSPFPVWGRSTSIHVLGGSTRALSSIDLFKILATFRYLRALSDRNTIIGGIQYGAIQSNDYDRVPISQRFFAGGDRSVRGFKYRDLSPRNSEDEAVGGRYLEVLSLEYNYRFLDRWSGALFADAGRAFNSFGEPYSVGAGFGVRWQSPVGPFRVDIAAPISNNDDGGVRVHLSLGPDL
jgi:translocation and assembly module TamA